jgi:hypothetical protein
LSSPPKVFISHASEDKERFVLQFATALRANGIDAWLDRWEMLPGDSVVDKIFEEGIKDAAAFIVVLSGTSVQKKWVREEMNAAFIARISRQCKVVPVVIDDCEIPEALKTTLWERIENLNDYGDRLKRIVAAIFDTRIKPPIGDSPAFLQESSETFAPELERTDAVVLWQLCETAFAQGHDVVGDLSALDELLTQGLAKSDLVDAFEVLDQQGLIQASRVLSGGYLGTSFSHARITMLGFDLFLRHKFTNFDEMVTQIAAKIVNEGMQHGNEIVEATNYPPILVEHVADLFKNNDLLKVSKSFGGYYVFNISPSLKRMLR